MGEARDILNRHCEYMDGLDRGQVSMRTSNALAAVEEALTRSRTITKEQVEAANLVIWSGMLDSTAPYDIALAAAKAFGLVVED